MTIRVFVIGQCCGLMLSDLSAPKPAVITQDATRMIAAFSNFYSNPICCVVYEKNPSKQSNITHPAQPLSINYIEGCCDTPASAPISKVCIYPTLDCVAFITSGWELRVAKRSRSGRKGAVLLKFDFPRSAALLSRVPEILGFENAHVFLLRV